MWDSPSRYILVVLLILVKKVRGIDAHTNRSLQITGSGINTVYVQYIICTRCLMTIYVQFNVRLNVPLGWSVAEAFSPLALSEDARTLLESP